MRPHRLNLIRDRPGEHFQQFAMPFETAEERERFVFLSFPLLSWLSFMLSWVHSSSDAQETSTMTKKREEKRHLIKIPSFQVPFNRTTDRLNERKGKERRRRKALLWVWVLKCARSAFDERGRVTGWLDGMASWPLCSVYIYETPWSNMHFVLLKTCSRIQNKSPNGPDRTVLSWTEPVGTWPSF